MALFSVKYTLLFITTRRTKNAIIQRLKMAGLEMLRRFYKFLVIKTLLGFSV